MTSKKATLIWGIVQNGKLRVETPRKYMYTLQGFLVLRELRAFDLTRVHVMSLIVFIDSYNQAFYIRGIRISDLPLVGMYLLTKGIFACPC